jgi:hypothetical protein
MQMAEHNCMRSIGLLLVSGLVLIPMATAPRAEVREVVLGQQYGAVYLPAMAMESQKLIEKHLAAAGLGNVKVSWAKLGGPAPINDAPDLWKSAFRLSGRTVLGGNLGSNKRRHRRQGVGRSGEQQHLAQHA